MLSLLARYRDDDLASSVSFFQIPNGLGNLAQPVTPVDDGRYLSGLYELAQDRHVLFVHFRHEHDEFLAHEARQHEDFERKSQHAAGITRSSGRHANATRSQDASVFAQGMRREEIENQIVTLRSLLEILLSLINDPIR